MVVELLVESLETALDGIKVAVHIGLEIVETLVPGTLSGPERENDGHHDWQGYRNELLERRVGEVHSCFDGSEKGWWIQDQTRTDRQGSAPKPKPRDVSVRL